MSLEVARRYTSLFDKNRLQIARAFRGLKKTDLADAVGVTPTAIAQYEAGVTKPSASTLALIALKLGQPVEFFAIDGLEHDAVDLQTANFRSLRTTTATERAKATARAYMVSLLVENMKTFVRFPEHALPDNLHVTEDADRQTIEKRAAQLRKLWGLPPGPLGNVVRLLEAKGIVVTRCSIDCKRVHAFSKLFRTGPIVVLDSDKESPDRLRFDAAHELGHFVLHAEAEAGNRIHEIQADQFAAAFLMPASDIVAELPTRVDEARFYVLKQKWGVSMQALFRRAYDLGRLSEPSYRRAIVRHSQHGQRMHESLYPLNSAPERCIVLSKAMELIEKQGVSVADLSRRARLPETFVSETIFDAELPKVRL